MDNQKDEKVWQRQRNKLTKTDKEIYIYIQTTAEKYKGRYVQRQNRGNKVQ